MKYALLLMASALLLGCSPEPPELDVATPPPVPTPAVAPSSSPDRSGTPSAADLAAFWKAHGSAYDPASRADREKMLAFTSTGKPAPPEPAPIVPAKTLREKVIAAGVALVGQQETDGKNRSKKIDAMNMLTGAALGSPYCASFNTWCYSKAKVPAGWPVSAWSPDWVRNPTWTAAKGGVTPLPADAFGIWFESKKRVAHTGLVREWKADGVVITIEANTSPTALVGTASDRDGDGVWSKRRMRSQIYSVRNWIGL